MFADGSSDLQGLHWTAWGKSVARTTGIRNLGIDFPNVAQGKRMDAAAEVTLSNPGRFQGHEMYRCFTLTVPPPATNLRECLAGHTGASG
jgi:hypothetical protein